MNNIKPLLGLFFVALAFWSCGESIIEVDLPEHEPRLVVTALPKDTTFSHLSENKIYLTSSSPIEGIPSELSINLIRNGTYSMHVDGVLYPHNFYNGRGFNNIDKIGSITIDHRRKDFRFEYGRTYNFNAQLEGYPTISATQTMPYPPDYQSITFDSIKKIDNKLTPYFTSLLRFQDHPDQKDFYRIQAYIFKRDDTSKKYPIWTWSKEGDFLQESLYDYSFLLSDDNFNGQEKSVELRIDTRFVNPEEDILVLNFARITEDTHRFHKSYRQHILAEETPFSEPITTYSNIEDGFGIFGLEASTLITIIP